MFSRSARILCDVRNLALMLVIGCVIRFSGGVRNAGMNQTCPALEHCSCKRSRGGAIVWCNSAFTDQKLHSDISRLQGLLIERMNLRYLNVTELPTSWFTNHRILKLIVSASGVGNAAAICSIKELYYIVLDINELQGVPSCLNGKRALRSLQLRKNPIKRLKGMLAIPRLRRLDLSHNGIESIDEEYLTGLPNLRILTLSHNNIHKLPPKLFNVSRLLETAKLGYNHISSVHDVFNHLDRLEVLDLQKNKIADAESLARSTLPRLKELKLGQNCLSTVAKFLSRRGGNRIERLDFSNNFLTDIMPGAFHGLRRLIILDLSNNSISHLRDSCFARDSILEGIDLSMNNLTAVSGSFFTARKIRAIRLSFNHIRDIRDAFSGLTELRMLYLRSNKISSIPDGTFEDNLQLIYIDLLANNIAWIGRNAFKGLVTLRKLRLERNRIISLNGSLNNLPKLEYLGASYNAILRLESSEFGNNADLRSISLKENNITDLRRAFTGATALRFVNLAGNQVELIRRSDFAREITEIPIIALHSNPLVCDCRMAWLIEGDSDTRMRIATCAKPRNLKGKQLRVLAQQDLVRWQDDCEPGCQCECNEGPLGEREISVKCSFVTEGHIPKVFPKGTTRLDLSANRLLRLDETVKKAAPLLQVLSLRDNMLGIINATYIPERLTSLDLRGNKLKRLPFLLLTQLNLTSIWLSGNQYTCECTDYYFTQWIQAHGNVVRDASEILCGKSANPLVSGKKFLTLGQNDLCPAKLPQGVVYFFLTLGLLGVSLAMSATYLRYRHGIRTWLRSHDICGLACWDEEDGKEMLFDVFVSFSSRDIEWVHDELLPALDAMGLSYCTYEKNFKGGYLLQDIIRDAVACSRRTLLVLTENFVASEWCRFEFRLAHQRALRDSINRLVIVLVEQLDPGALDEGLRLYLRTANYLLWGEPNFWDRLLHSLSSRRAKNKVIVKGERTPPEVTANAHGDIELK